jgi:hypothetical protein
VHGPTRAIEPLTELVMSGRELTYGEAVREALAEEMRVACGRSSTWCSTTTRSLRPTTCEPLFSPALVDLTLPSARMVFEAAKALSRRSERFLTITIERRKIALTGDES